MIKATYFNESVMVFDSGTVNINKEVNFFGFRVYLDVDFSFEPNNMDFNLCFRVDKDWVKSDIDEWRHGYWQTPIVFVHLDPFSIGEMLGTVGINGEEVMVRVPRAQRDPSLSLKVGKRWILRK